MGVVRVAASLRACVGEGQGVGGGRPGGGAVSLEGEQASVPVVGDVLLGQRCKRRCGGSAVSGTPDKASGAVVLVGVCRRQALFERFLSGYIRINKDAPREPNKASWALLKHFRRVNGPQSECINPVQIGLSNRPQI